MSGKWPKHTNYNPRRYPGGVNHGGPWWPTVYYPGWDAQGGGQGSEVTQLVGQLKAVIAPLLPAAPPAPKERPPGAAQAQGGGPKAAGASDDTEGTRECPTCHTMHRSLTIRYCRKSNCRAKLPSPPDAPPQQSPSPKAKPEATLASAAPGGEGVSASAEPVSYKFVLMKETKLAQLFAAKRCLPNPPGGGEAKDAAPSAPASTQADFGGNVSEGGTCAAAELKQLQDELAIFEKHPLVFAKHIEAHTERINTFKEVAELQSKEDKVKLPEDRDQLLAIVQQELAKEAGRYSRGKAKLKEVEEEIAEQEANLQRKREKHQEAIAELESSHAAVLHRWETGRANILAEFGMGGAPSPTPVKIVPKPDSPHLSDVRLMEAELTSSIDKSMPESHATIMKQILQFAIGASGSTPQDHSGGVGSSSTADASMGPSVKRGADALSVMAMVG